jgi:hypothetical protein
MKTLFLAALPLIALVGFTSPTQAEPAPTCDAVTAPSVPGVTVTGVTGVVRRDYEVPPPFPGVPPITDIPDFCEVTITLTHPGAGDHVTVETWLPLENWSGRFQGTGGGGYAAGIGDSMLAEAVKGGYAAAATDGGLGPTPFGKPGWFLTPEGDDLFTNFASRSVHDMTVAGKAVTAWFYERPADYSYWNGCSTGGRQGMMEAQRFPDDYDGINAAAPAINWDRFIMADHWPQVVMRQERNLMSPCELEAFRTAAVAACDLDDRVADGIISDPARCRYDPRALIGTEVLCEGQQVTISRADAEVIAKIWAGPRGRHGEWLWFGLTKGSSFAGVATADLPFPISAEWITHFLKRDPEFDLTSVSYRDFERLFVQSVIEYGRTIGTADPDLSDFRDAGGKMITWHGQADDVIVPGGTVRYREQVELVLGGRSEVDKFFRVFLAPGVGHCDGGGPTPVDPMAALVAWVERGEAPAVLPAANGAVTRDLCRYPLVSRYDGHGDPNSAASYRCARRF